MARSPDHATATAAGLLFVRPGKAGDLTVGRVTRSGDRATAGDEAEAVRRKLEAAGMTNRVSKSVRKE